MPELQITSTINFSYKRPRGLGIFGEILVVINSKGHKTDIYLYFLIN